MRPSPPTWRDPTDLGLTSFIRCTTTKYIFYTLLGYTLPQAQPFGCTSVEPALGTGCAPAPHNLVAESSSLACLRRKSNAHIWYVYLFFWRGWWYNENIIGSKEKEFIEIYRVLRAPCIDTRPYLDDQEGA